MKPIIRVEGLSKRYRIGAAAAPYATLRETLSGVLRAPLGALRGGRADEEMWALRDVSFEVRPGEAVGIIGRNGAGKSTLLKVLSRITEPTAGRVELYGRVGSLLEVGTGFHPELTGRENIYLNGSILGMRRFEIERKFDEIVEFAEVNRFLDTPVKRYSSGMYMRLAFAVAAHLEPEILIVDEVLAVGDAAFQAKCLGKMGDVTRAGRTVLFVSHSLASIANLCPRAILMSQGAVRLDGHSSEVVNEYIALGRENRGERVWDDPQAAPGGEKVRLRAVRVVSDDETTADVDISREVRLEVDFYNLQPGALVSTSIQLLDKMGGHVLASANMPSASLGRDEWFGRPHPAGLYRAACTLPANFLNEGRYSVNALVLTDVSNIEASATEAVSFVVHDTGEMRREFGGGWVGVVRPKLAWRTEYLDPAA
jgi:lipopolysaccharide transport system ATP-binding protein